MSSPQVSATVTLFDAACLLVIHQIVGQGAPGQSGTSWSCRSRCVLACWAGISGCGGLIGRPDCEPDSDRNHHRKPIGYHARDTWDFSVPTLAYVPVVREYLPHRLATLAQCCCLPGGSP